MLAAPLVVHFGAPHAKLTDDLLLELSSLNPELRLERIAAGDLVIMAPTGGEGARKNALATVRIAIWAEADGRGVYFDSSGGFCLPNGAVRAPDFSWVLNSRYEAIPLAERKKFPPLTPDFVLRYGPRRILCGSWKRKMTEYIENGATMGVLIDPLLKTVSIYRQAQPVQKLYNPETVDLSPEMSGLVLKMADIWD